MKIVHVCPYDLDRPGGVQSHIRDTAAAFVRLGHDVTLVAPRVSLDSPREETTPGGTRIVRVGGWRTIPLGVTSFPLTGAFGDEGRVLAELMGAGAFDLAHYHGVWTPVLPAQAFLCSNIASVMTVHDTPSTLPAGRLARAIYPAFTRMLLPNFDGVIAVSDSPLSYLRPGRGQRISIIPPCTDLGRFSRGSRPRSPSAEGPVEILFLSRLETRKGAGLLLQAYRRLTEERLDVRLTIAGSGPKEAELRRYVAEHRLEGVSFVGAIAESNLPAQFEACDIFCAPAPFGESFGIVIAEAMASGRPVVAAANAGFRTVLTGEGARFLTPPGDADALYRGLKTLVLDPALRAEMGAWGQAQSARYDAAAITPQLLGVYEEALEVNARRRRRRGRPVMGDAGRAAPAAAP